MNLLIETDEIEQDHRAARLYRFHEAKYRRLEKEGSTLSYKFADACRFEKRKWDLGPYSRMRIRSTSTTSNFPR
jgi:hypothetical protein